MNKHIVVIYPAQRTFIFDIMTSKPDTAILEDVFAWFNAGSNQEMEIFLDSHIRSFSVNDFIGIDGKYYQCSSVGWQEVQRNEINDVVEFVEHNVNSFNSPWSVLNDYCRENPLRGNFF